MGAEAEEVENGPPRLLLLVLCSPLVLTACAEETPGAQPPTWTPLTPAVTTPSPSTLVTDEFVPKVVGEKLGKALDELSALGFRIRVKYKVERDRLLRQYEAACGPLGG
jgi:hypothetical protein